MGFTSTYLLISLIIIKNIMIIRIMLIIRLNEVINSMLLMKSKVVLPIRIKKGESSGSKWDVKSYVKNAITYMEHIPLPLFHRTWHNILIIIGIHITVNSLKVLQHLPAEHLQTPFSLQLECRFRYRQDSENSHCSSIRLAIETQQINKLTYNYFIFYLLNNIYYPRWLDIRADTRNDA